MISPVIALRLLRPALVLLALVTGETAWGTTIPEAIRIIRARANTNLAEQVPGLSAAVGQHGKIIWSEGFGFADLAARKPVTARTRFRIGSVSKPLTAAGLMLLVQAGRLELDADIRTYLAKFPDKGHVITARQLGGHLAGVRHYQSLEFYLNKPYASVTEGLKIFQDDPLLSIPGEKYSYSSYGYNLLSAVMEVAAKEDFLSYMEHAIFAPLKMTNTVPDRAGAAIPERTKFYDVSAGGGFKIAPPVDNSYKWAGGGFLSTPEDLVRFGLALLHPGFLKRESLATLFTSQKTSDGKPTGYGLGWNIRRENGRRFFLHTGGSVGGTSVLMLFPDSGVVLAMVSNCSKSPFDKSNINAIAAEFCGALDQR